MEKEIRNLEKIKKSIKKKIKSLRLAHNLSINELSTRTRLKKNKLILMEQGYKIHDLYTLYKLAKFYKMDIIDFLK